mmetsp:Transcript_87195/g.249824  ORF Transcript_87195/g.249824 Transcript_87195/m.249824 type:complete len:302 (+) Transcript_87195:148-1053(+)
MPLFGRSEPKKDGREAGDRDPDIDISGTVPAVEVRASHGVVAESSVGSRSEVGGRDAHEDAHAGFQAEAEPFAEAEAGGEYDPCGVWVHIYHTDPYTAWLNWAGLKYAEVPIHHAGVEVDGIEWAFQYFDDAWDDHSISGVTCCEPRTMNGFEYQESVYMGPTPLSHGEVRGILDGLRSEWSASSYHLTRHNCLTFAQQFAGLLNVQEPFPPKLLGFANSQQYMPVTDAIVDVGWSWYKWGMQRNAAAVKAQEEEGARTPEEAARVAAQGSVSSSCSVSCWRPSSSCPGLAPEPQPPSLKL